MELDLDPINTLRLSFNLKENNEHHIFVENIKKKKISRFFLSYPLNPSVNE